MAGQRTRAQSPPLSREAPKLGDPADINQHRGLCDAKRHHRHEALTAGENSCFRPMTKQRIARRRERIRAQVGERRRLHDSDTVTVSTV